MPGLLIKDLYLRNIVLNHTSILTLIYISILRENYFKWWIKVEGLNHTEIRHLAEKIGEQPEHQVDSEKLAEFSVPSWLVRERGAG